LRLARKLFRLQFVVLRGVDQRRRFLRRHLILLLAARACGWRRPLRLLGLLLVRLLLIGGLLLRLLLVFGFLLLALIRLLLLLLLIGLLLVLLRLVLLLL